MSIVTPATPTGSASPSVTKKGASSLTTRLRSLGVDVVFGIAAFIVAAVALDSTIQAILDPGFWPTIGGVAVLLLALAGVWLVADQGLIGPKLIRFLIGIVLLLVATIVLVSGGRFGPFNGLIFWSVTGILVAAAVETALFWLRRWLSRSLKL